MIVPARVNRAQAAEFVRRFHRHHEPDQGDRFVLGCWDESRETLCGVAVAGNPRAPTLARDPGILEVTRVCVDSTRNACSFLYSGCARMATILGYRAVITYTLASEGGASLRALGWWPESLDVNPTTTWANRPGRKTDNVRADIRWMWLCGEFRAPPCVHAVDPQIQLLVMEGA